MKISIALVMSYTMARASPSFPKANKARGNPRKPVLPTVIGRYSPRFFDLVSFSIIAVMVPIPRMTKNEEIDMLAAFFRSRVDFAIEKIINAGPVMYMMRSVKGTKSTFLFFPMRYPTRMMRKVGRRV